MDDFGKPLWVIKEEVERLKVQAMMGWHKEFRNLQWYGLQNGMSVLELGSGPGFVTEQLANILPDSEITALEIDSSLLDEARNRLHYIPSSRLHFVQNRYTIPDYPIIRTILLWLAYSFFIYIIR